MSLHDPMPAPRVAAASSARFAEPWRNGDRVGRSVERDDDAASDEVLMVRIVAGDQAAFHSLARRHVARCLAVAQRIVGNPSDAEEVVQDAMLRVWLHAPAWRAGSARVTTWIYRIVVNLALDGLRKNRSRVISIDEAGDPVDPAPDAQMLAEGRQLEAFVARAIAELPARQRAALTLCYFEAMDCADAAQIMGISVSAMESLLVRGRRTLRMRLHRRAGEAVRRPPPAHAGRQKSMLDPPVGRFAGSLA